MSRGRKGVIVEDGAALTASMNQIVPGGFVDILGFAMATLQSWRISPWTNQWENR